MENPCVVSRGTPLHKLSLVVIVLCNYCKFNCVYAGTDRPTLKYINRHVKTFITAQWYDIGVDLLDEKDVSELKTIRINHQGDAGKCTTAMLELWLRVKSDASWNQLIQTFRQPNIRLQSLASDIENMLLKGMR